MRLTLTRVGSPRENWRASEKELSAIEQQILELSNLQPAPPEILRTLANLTRARDRASRTADQYWKLLLEDFAEGEGGIPQTDGISHNGMARETPTAQAAYLETVLRRMITNGADRRAIRAELTAQAAECDRRRSETQVSEAHRDSERHLSNRIRALLFFVRTGALMTGVTEADLELCRQFQDNHRSEKRTD